MKVLSIGTDRLVFDPKSDVRRRLIEYGDLFDGIHVIVFARGNLTYKDEKISDKAFVYPTNSLNRLFYVWQAIKIGRTLLGNSKDWIITSQDPFETGLVAWWLKWRKGIQWQAQIHTDFLSPFFAKESWLNWFRVKIASFLLPRADKIRVVSKRIKESLGSWNLRTEIVVLPIFVPASVSGICDESMDLHKKYPQFSFVILMASRLTKEKNFDLALRSFARASINREDIGLVVVGQGPEKKHLQDLAKILGRQDQIIFEDWRSDLSCYYQTADLFMLTSNYEGYGRTLIEAGLNGCPVLTTRIGLVGEEVTDENALICEVSDGDCLAEKVLFASTHQEEIEILGRRFKSELREKASTREKYLVDYKAALLGS